MKKIITTEDVRRSTYWTFDYALLSLLSMLTLTKIVDSKIATEINLITLILGFSFLTLLFVVLMLINFFINIRRKKHTDNKFGAALRKELGIERLTFTKLNNNTIELHHKTYGVKEMVNFKINRLTKTDIKILLKEQLVEDFKKLEAFLKEEAKKNDGLRVTTFTHVAMLRVWNKRAREAGISFEVVEDHSQKPVGYKWWDWMCVVLMTTGSLGRLGSKPRPEDWKMYRLRSKCL